MRNRPELLPGLQFILDSFNTLSARRGQGMGGRQPISMQDLASFFWIYGIANLSERERLIRFIEELDYAYLEEMAKRDSTVTVTDAKS